MRLDDQRESSNVEDRRGMGGGGGRGGGNLLGGLIGGRMGIGGLIVVGIIALVLGINPLTLLGGGGGAPGGGAPREQIGQPNPASGPALQPASDMDRLVARAPATTEDSWGEAFPREVGAPYQPPTLVLSSGGVDSACGSASSAMGPFYCPGDRKVYLDQSFFDQLAQRFGAPGDFAAAYVIAHEVGHHIQTITGISEQVRGAQARASKTEGNALQVRMELQADCLAGVWAQAHKDLLDEGDVDEALAAANAIGDDTLQRAAQGTVVPESFTHGSSAQRKSWFMNGFRGGTIASCDTFAARRL
ncbi:flagellar biosynthesis protein FlgM [Polymorphobacter multimanifer]|uniref:KPN_02809 family neutral zinc metallopeptidase n=1 Tax=Polymorphobacter multimanifer TaxID=1070431 RepID=UPI001664ECE0|nr:neutral zinc metallopeptidase [Polymorphobacter multimanifer]GGI77540.1 flagellar biosynthesis protein FlgM [Polymorphobacter multimanifer]